MKKTFKGLLLDDGVDRIRLSTKDGKTGYVMKKLQAIGHEPQTKSYESVIQVYTVPKSTASCVINFGDPTLIGAIYVTGDSAPSQVFDQTIIIDTVKFNQDIYITHNNDQGAAINYYVELEQVRLDTSEATVATLKDMRGRE